MDNIQHVLVPAMVLVVATLFFPVQGEKALRMRIINGLFYGCAAILLALVVAGKAPSLGWLSKSIVLLLVLSCLCAGKAIAALAKSLSDFFGKRLIEVRLSPWELYRGSMTHTAYTVYRIKGTDREGRKHRFRINKGTFNHFLGVPGQYTVCLCVYAHTKIIKNIEILGGFSDGKN